MTMAGVHLKAMDSMYWTESKRSLEDNMAALEASMQVTAEAMAAIPPLPDQGEASNFQPAHLTLHMVWYCHIVSTTFANLLPSLLMHQLASDHHQPTLPLRDRLQSTRRTVSGPTALLRQRQTDRPDHVSDTRCYTQRPQDNVEHSSAQSNHGCQHK